MQQEIIELQPELIKTSEETHTLMVKIEKDTVEAEAKKEVGLTVWCGAHLLGVVHVCVGVNVYVCVYVHMYCMYASGCGCRRSSSQ